MSEGGTLWSFMSLMMSFIFTLTWTVAGFSAKADTGPDARAETKLSLEASQRGTTHLTEKKVAELAHKESAQALQFRSQRAAAAYALNSFANQFAPQIEASVSHTDSEEKSIAVFIPTFGPTYAYTLGLHKKFAAGTDISLSTFAEKQSTKDGSIENAARTGVKLTASFDLWKNIFGRLDQANLKNLALVSQKAKIESEVNIRTFELEMRKLYWSMVANEEALNISRRLLASSEQQLKDAQQRFKASIADRGEVARYQAQKASREAMVINLEYQREQMNKLLKSQLPELAAQQLKLAPLNLSTTVATVLKCTKKIQLQKDFPWDETLYDEMIGLLESAYKQQRLVTSYDSSIDLALNSSMQMSGVDEGFSDSYDDFSANGEVGYQVGVTMTMPLGQQKQQSEKLKHTQESTQSQMQIQQLKLALQAEYEQAGRLIQLLQRSVGSIQNNSTYLETSLEEMKKKYRQARVSVNELINDQDTLHNSLMQEVEAKLTVIHTLLDYFKIFTENACELNQVI